MSIQQPKTPEENELDETQIPPPDDGVNLDDFLDLPEVSAGDLEDQDGGAYPLERDAEINTKLEARIEELSIQLAETRDQLLRKTADFENFRKRMNQEKQKSIEFANESLLLDIIPMIDDFERAIQSAELSAELTELPAGKAMLDGITMIEKQFVNKLEQKWGLKRFNCAGEPFDPNIHEAMLVEKSPGIEEPVVIEDFSKGYRLKDRLIRAAKVKVAVPDTPAQGAAQGGGEQEGN